MTHYKQYLKLFWELLKTDLFILKSSIWGDVIDTILWVTTILLTATYVLPMLGMTTQFGAFVAVASIASCSFFRVFAFASQFLADLEGNNTISYPMTLPLPSWMVIAKGSVVYMIHVALVSMLILPLAKLILLSRLDLGQLSVFKTLVMYFTLHLFSGFFALFITSLVKNMMGIMAIWNRALFPLWFFGGSQFSWYTLKALAPNLAYVGLFNPFLYPMEGIHSAILGHSDYLPFWMCIGVSLSLMVIFGIMGIMRFKKRLDFV
jgi:hypothetical protein